MSPVDAPELRAETHDASAGAAPVHLPGIGEPLPAGERLLWTGSPDRRAVARRICHTRGVLAYFGVLLVVGVLSTISDGLSAALVPTALLGMMGATVYAFSHVYATLVARTSVYAVTEKRVVLRIGVAIPAVINLPLDQIESIDLRPDRDGTGDVTMALTGDTRLAWLLVWPHTRPWRLAKPEPGFRCIPEAAEVGRLLAEAAQARLAVPTPAAAEPALPAPLAARVIREVA